MTLIVLHECEQSFCFYFHKIQFWVCQWNDQVRQSTFLCPNIEFAWHLARRSNMIPPDFPINFMTSSLLWNLREVLINAFAAITFRTL